MQHTTSRSRLAAVALALAGALVALLGPAAVRTEAAPAPLRVGQVQLGCECGGAGYLWGWAGVFVPFSGARAGHTYRVGIQGGSTVKVEDVYGTSGGVFVDRDKGGFRAGRTYRFTVSELRGKRVVRTSPVKRLRIPTPVVHPDRAHLDTLTLDGEEVMVSGETYTITFDGTWGEDARFASGVDRYHGVVEGDDRFGWYQDEDYPLPWRSRGAEPIVRITPPADLVGTMLHVKVIGYRPAPRADRDRGIAQGDPVKGTEWGYEFDVRVVAPEDVPAEPEPEPAGANRTSSPGRS